MPTEVNNLIEIARIKNLCRKTNIIKLQQKQNGVVVFFKNIPDEMLKKIIENYGSKVRFSPGEKPYITLKIEKDTMKEIKEFLEKIK